MRFFLSFSLLLLFAFSCKTSQQSSTTFLPTFSISDQTTHQIPKGQTFTFGYLTVPENRKKPASNSIKLPVYIFKSRNPQPQPDPIIYTVGGPGSSTMRSAKYMKYYQYLDDRDFILVEQRGTQYAQPHLACPEWAAAISLSQLPNFNQNQSDSLFEQAAKNCKERLVAKGIDLNGYNTNEIAADIEDLRKALKIEKYNLLTISYSTKIAQVLMRDYPEAIRSVVMDSPLPLEVNYDEESTGNLLEAVEKLLSACTSDQACHTAFPDLKARFFQYLRDKTVNPLMVSVNNPNTQKEEIFYLRGKDLITVFSYARTNDVPDIPFEINQLLNNDLSTVKQQLAYLFRKPGNGNGKGMRLSVWCAEEYPFVSQAKVTTATYQYPEIKGLSPAVFKANVCDIWGVEQVKPIENKPVKSDIPVLLISGEYDEETPPKWAANMQKNLRNSHHLIFKGWKHTATTNWGNNCAMQAANMFFNDPTQMPLPACLKALEQVKFKTK